MPCPAAMAVRVEGICLRVRRGQAFKAAAARCSTPLALPLRSFGVKRHEQRKSSFPGSFIIISGAFAKKKKKKKNAAQVMDRFIAHTYWHTFFNFLAVEC